MRFSWIAPGNSLFCLKLCLDTFGKASCMIVQLMIWADEILICVLQTRSLLASREENLDLFSCLEKCKLSQDSNSHFAMLENRSRENSFRRIQNSSPHQSWLKGFSFFAEGFSSADMWVERILVAEEFLQLGPKIVFMKFDVAEEIDLSLENLLKKSLRSSRLAGQKLFRQCCSTDFSAKPNCWHVILLRSEKVFSVLRRICEESIKILLKNSSASWKHVLSWESFVKKSWFSAEEKNAELKKSSFFTWESLNSMSWRKFPQLNKNSSVQKFLSWEKILSANFSWRNSCWREKLNSQLKNFLSWTKM